MTSQPHTSVLVVGAGPSGLVTGILLAGAGFDVRLLERLTSPREGTRAPTLWPRAMNVMDLIGCGEEIRAVAHRVENLAFVDDDARAVVPLEDLACWTLPQYRLEEILEHRARQFGVAISRGVEITGLADHAAGEVRVMVRGDEVDNKSHAASLLIAADGARSVIRTGLGIEFAGHEYESRFGLVDFVDQTGEHASDTVETYTGAAGTLVTVPLPDGVVRCVAPLGEQADDASNTVIEQRLRSYGFDGRFGDIQWQAVFHVSVKLAETFHRGGVALIGDAAHLQSPAGGRGMNNAIEDAEAVAMRIITAATRTVPDYARALESYARERRRAIEPELGLIQRRTDRWVSGSPADGPEATGATAEPQHSELPEQRQAALRAAGLPLDPAAELDEPPSGDDRAVVGREVYWRNLAITPNALGRPLVFIVGEHDIPLDADMAAISQVWRIPQLYLSGLQGPAPNGIYATRADGVVLAHWPDRVLHDQPSIAATIQAASLQADTHTRHWSDAPVPARCEP